MTRSIRQWLSAVAGAALAAGGIAFFLRAAEPPLPKLDGQAVADFSLPDLHGKSWSLSQALQGKKLAVIVFVSTECPMSNAYLQPLAELAKNYEPQGVAFAAINANAGEDAEVLAAHAKEFAIPFPLLVDAKQKSVAVLRPSVNPEAFVLDAQRVVRYRGRIDDGYYERLKKAPTVKRFDLQIALDELLAGKPVTTPVTKALGCQIVLCAPDNAATGGEVTYYRDVLPILQNHCQTCHRPGEVGPFSLMTYRQAFKWGDDIKTYTQNRTMPPWKPVGAHGMFMNERQLTDKEIATLAKWVDTGMKEGDPKDAPLPRVFTEGWTLGAPDLVLEVPEEMQIGPTGNDLFRCFVLKTNFTEDKYVKAFEVRPGNRRVVHHTLNFLVAKGSTDALLEAERKKVLTEKDLDRGPGYTVTMGVGRGVALRGGMGGWAPGQVPRPLPPGIAYRIPKDCDFVIQTHYHRTGRLEKDKLRIGLYFAKPEEKITMTVQATVLPGAFLFIPPNQSNYKVTGTMYLDQDATLLSIMPHMHLLGKNIKTTMTLPNGTTKTLIDIPDWNYNWQETYFFREPIKVPAGTRFDVVAHYDNSAANPLNPNNPPRLVKLGEQTTDEMCFVFFNVVSESGSRVRMRLMPPTKPAAP